MPDLRVQPAIPDNLGVQAGKNRMNRHTIEVIQYQLTLKLNPSMKVINQSIMCTK